MKDARKEKPSKARANIAREKSASNTQSLAKDSPKRKLIKILSLDGGGIRGIIPALVLQDIENKLKHKKHLSECFDMMSGTSTGGIIALLLTTPDAKNKPKYRASDVVSLYQNLGSSIFNQSWWRYLTTCDGWINEKYSSDHLKMNLEKFYGDCRLQDALTNIFIPAYDISQDDYIFFKSDKAKVDLARDFYFRDVAQATSAAPTYFKPAQIQDISYQKKYTLVDGGLGLNNPALSACIHALKLFGRDCDFLVVSIGTGTNHPVTPGKLSFEGKPINNGGKLEWAPSIVPLMMNATNEVVDYQMREVFKDDKGVKRYHRFQVLLDAPHTAFDNTSPENIKALENYAKELIHQNQADFTEIAHLLDG